MATEQEKNRACENEYDGVEKMELVGEILDLRTKLAEANERIKNACKQIATIMLSTKPTSRLKTRDLWTKT
ncbi:hypothetical protein LCGC14_0743170 [marine sediment metagenome]|uniref:Uncharacterized protein n=1 Tax=marine sediment metagenome TaxID=412755 RepID=A0A0F9QR59_9ZZZZ